MDVDSSEYVRERLYYYLNAKSIINNEIQKIRPSLIYQQCSQIVCVCKNETR